MSGKAFYGKTEDGSDIQEFEGVYINPKNLNEWSNQPYLITNPYIEQYDKITQFLPKEKEFVCKGLHQYKEMNGEWVCQCNKKL